MLAGTIGGAGGLTKLGAGTLTLTGANAYGGGTAINGGALAVGSDANLGAAAGGLAFGGGTLQFLAGFTSNRIVTLNAGGGTFDTNGNNATLGGIITGSGSLTKTGTGALNLLGANNYTGGTTINAGSVLLGDTTHTASIVGSITNNADLQFLNVTTTGITTIANNGTAAFSTPQPPAPPASPMLAAWLS
jgi:fibronectin-binding autotransporter adhesin